MHVVPLVGTWIEMYIAAKSFIDRLSSFPSWERGLKFRVTLL